jgi:hypothetical protein
MTRIDQAHLAQLQEKLRTDPNIGVKLDIATTRQAITCVAHAIVSALEIRGLHVRGDVIENLAKQREVLAQDPLVASLAPMTALLQTLDATANGLEDRAALDNLAQRLATDLQH